MAFDLTQRITLGIVILAAAYFVGHTLHKKNRATAKQSAATEQGAAEVTKTAKTPQMGVSQIAKTTGAGSPIIQASGAAKVDFRAEISAEEKTRIVNETAKATADKVRVDADESAKERFKEVKCGPDPNVDCPLKVHFFLSPDPHPSGAIYDGIKWEDIDSDLRIHFRNAGTRTIHDISLDVQPEVQISAMGQVTKIADVTVAPVLGPVVALEVVMTLDSDGSQRSIPADLNSRSGQTARVLCPRLLPNAEMQVVFACRATNPLENGELPKRLFSEKRIPPKNVRLKGTYVVSENGIETRYSINSGIRLPVSRTQ